MTDTTFTLDAYDYDLPPERIAQFPAPERDQSRLLVLDVPGGTTAHLRFTDIVGYLRPGDLLVVNNTRVFPARLLGRKATGGRVELLLLAFPRQTGPTSLPGSVAEASATALLKCSKRPKAGETLYFSEQLSARIGGYSDDGKAQVTLRYTPGQGQTLEDILSAHGRMPLPPYILRPDGDLEDDLHRYQTRYALHTGSVAAPTAGLHFSDGLLANIAAMGVETAEIVLHVGYGTFAPVRTEDIREHVIHQEEIEVTATTAALVNRTREQGGRVWAVGTTTVRALEFATGEDGRVRPVSGPCGLFIYPGFRFRAVDNLITNFHLPKSSLLFLVSALGGRERVLEAYRQAVEKRYRFFSYGDAMALITRP